MLTKLSTNYAEGQQVNDYICTATDEKPTDCGNGSTLYEIDTYKKYAFNRDSCAWIESGKSKLLASIAIATAPTKVNYNDGEDFDPAGAVVNATYSDSSTAAVSDNCVWPEKVHYGETVAVCSYVDNGVIRKAEQSITVAEPSAE